MTEDAAATTHVVTTAKQDPAGKGQKAAASDGKTYYSYADVHEAVVSLVPALKEFDPAVIIAIGGGGYVPARMLRTSLKIPVLAVSLELYDDATNTISEVGVRKIQWYDERSDTGSRVAGNRVLVVDEVDDTRTTLQYCVEELARADDPPSEIAVAVVHNKIKPKKGVLPENVSYFTGVNVPDRWNCYPWDAEAYGNDIRRHEELARHCSEMGNNGDDD